LAHHREEVPLTQLDRVAALNYGGADPSDDELQGKRWRDNVPEDFFGRQRFRALADLGLDLAPAYWSASEEHYQKRQEFHHHALSNFWMMPEAAIPCFTDALRQTHGEASRWSAEAFWPETWKEAWIPPLLLLLRNPDPQVRLWAVRSLGQIADL